MKKSILGLILASQLLHGCTSQPEVKSSPTPAATQVATESKQTEDEVVLAVNALMGQQKFEEAIALASKGLEQYPDSFSLLTNRASIRVHIEKYEEARPDLLKALELAPPERKWTIQSLLGRCAAGLGLLNKAEEDFAKAAVLLAKDPEPVPAFEEQLWRLRANNLANDLYYKEAIENYTKALKVEPEKLESLMGRALASMTKRASKRRGSGARD